MPKTPTLRRGQRLAGPERDKIAQHLVKRYETGLSVRQLSAETGYSLGRIRRLLIDGGVEFRRRGGAHKKVPQPRPAAGKRSARAAS